MNSNRASQFVAGRQREQPLLAASPFLLGSIDGFVIVVVMWGQPKDCYEDVWEREDCDECRERETAHRVVGFNGIGQIKPVSTQACVRVVRPLTVAPPFRRLSFR